MESLIARLADEMGEGWRTGRYPRVEEFLDRHPDLRQQPAAVMDLLYEEICLRYEQGQSLDAEEIRARFPRWGPQIELLLDCFHTLEAPGLSSMPRVGEVLRDFRLLAELGHGSQGRVFLATQCSLADRRVVLKITKPRGDEHLSLARLQHTHIVPLLSVVDEPGRNLRVLCMPYLGGLSLADLVDCLQATPPAHRTGRHILEALDRSAEPDRSSDVTCARTLAPPSSPTTPRSPARQFLERATYSQALAWFGACLAEALHYAHERGLVHLDLKPSNVLLTADGQPMLLDFHLAREPLRPGHPCGCFGGTPAYMSPEQRRAMAAIQAGGAIPSAIDGRSDIYSLGLVLCHALGGAARDEAGNPPLPLQRCNPQVPLGLCDIIAKCMAAHAGARYQTGAALAADLGAHLNDLPLKGVANRSFAERWRKWRRRRPHRLAMLAMQAILVLVAGAAVALGLAHMTHRVDEARATLAEGQQLLVKGRYQEAAAAFKRGLLELETVPGQHGLRRELTEHVRQAARSQTAQELHEVADRFRLLFGVDSFPPTQVRALETRCREFWEKRELILDRLQRAAEPDLTDKIPQAARQPVAEPGVDQDLLDLAILGAQLRVRLASHAPASTRQEAVAAAHREALEVLRQAEALFRPSAVLYQERRTHAEALGQTDAARAAQLGFAKFPPRTAWEHYAVGRSLLHAQQPESAADHLERAVALAPDSLWPNFYHGLCCYRLGRFDDAALAFTACTTLAPSVAGCFYNRGLALVGLGRKDRALRDFNRALELAPALAEAAFDRGVLHFQEKRLSQAAADFQAALVHGIDPGRAHRQLALLRLDQKDRAGALAHLEQLRKLDPADKQTVELIKKLQNQR